MKNKEITKRLNNEKEQLLSRISSYTFHTPRWAGGLGVCTGRGVGGGGGRFPGGTMGRRAGASKFMTNLSHLAL